MKDVVSTIASKGIIAARGLAETSVERISVDAAYAVMNVPRDDLFYVSRLVTTLPHKGGKVMERWVRPTDDGRVCRWEGGFWGGEPAGVPFSAKSRMILLYLVNQAIKTGARRIYVAKSMYEWARKIHCRSLGGATYRVISEHSRSITSCSLAIAGNGECLDSVESVPLIDDFDDGSFCWPKSGRYDSDEPRQIRTNTPPAQVALNVMAMAALAENPILVRESALMQLSDNSAAIDLFIRLADRLPSIQQPTMASWSSLGRKFASGYQAQKHIKPAISDLLQLVCAVYPEANVKFCPDGVLLCPSEPPIVVSPS